MAYIHKVDTDTLGRKITIYGLDVSGQNVEKAGQTIRKAFQDKSCFPGGWQSGISDNCRGNWDILWMREHFSLHYSFETQRDQTRTFLASWKNYEIEYQVNKDEIAEQAAFDRRHFGEKERTGSPKMLRSDIARRTRNLL